MTWSQETLAAEYDFSVRLLVDLREKFEYSPPNACKRCPAPYTCVARILPRQGSVRLTMPFSDLTVFPRLYLHGSEHLWGSTLVFNKEADPARWVRPVCFCNTVLVSRFER